MSISVDDLVASLSGSHIGQEAMDLAALQTQLAQALFAQAGPLSINCHQRMENQPCNTPTAHTPSSSQSFGDMNRRHGRSSSIVSRTGRSRTNSGAGEHWGDVDEMDEDEQMVEDLLTPASPAATGSSFTFSQNHLPRPSNYNSFGEPSPSLFTSTDPFYIAQMQAAQNPQVSSSFFAQAGKPAQHSPFMQHPHYQPQHAFAHAIPVSAFQR